MMWACTPGVLDHFQGSFARLKDIRLFAIKESRARLSIRYRCANWLLDFVRQGGGEFTHCAHTIYVSEVRK